MSKADAVLRAIVEQEVDVQELVEAQANRLDVTKGRLRKLARRVYQERLDGKLGKREAKKLFVTAFSRLMLDEFAHDVSSMKALIDSHVVEQAKAIAEHDGSPLRAVTNAEVKARATEKRLAKENK